MKFKQRVVISLIPKPVTLIPMKAKAIAERGTKDFQETNAVLYMGHINPIFP